MIERKGRRERLKTREDPPRKLTSIHKKRERQETERE
jgi:hypothetical protein